MNQQTIQSVLNDAKIRLQHQYNQNEIHSLMMLVLQHYLNISSTSILAYQDTKVSNSDYNQINQAVEKLKKHIPVQYILGETEFYGYCFNVNQTVLIPRPETEELVNWIIEDNKLPGLNILDIGTGSGCIAVTLAKELGNATVSAMDISEQALNTARENAELNKVNINFLRADILSEISEINSESLDIIVSNPPYVRMIEKEQMEANVLNNEPHLALFVDDNNPLLFYNKIAQKAMQWLKPFGKLYFEINEQFGFETEKMLKEVGFIKTQLRKDIHGKNRMLKGQKPG